MDRKMDRIIDRWIDEGTDRSIDKYTNRLMGVWIEIIFMILTGILARERRHEIVQNT